MHPALREILDRTLAAFEKDPRVLACWLSGSAGSSSKEDEFSDVDPVFVVRDEEFDNIDRELRSIFESICPDIVLWWPEVGNCDTAKNYAVLLKTPELVQYDVNILKESAFSAACLGGAGLEQIIFDKTGLLHNALRSAGKGAYSPEKLVWHIERWWLYAYINVKYLRRGDMFKLFFVQSTLFDDHMEILHALHPDAHWEWWPINVKRCLSKEKQAELLDYFTASDRDSLVAAIKREMEVFSRDARRACEVHGLQYPEAWENEVRRYMAEKIG